MPSATRAQRPPRLVVGTARCLMFALLGIVAIGLSACGGSSETANESAGLGSIEVSGSMGVAGAWDPEYPSVIKLDFTGGAADFRGTLRVSDSSSGAASGETYAMELEVPQRTRRRVSIPVEAYAWSEVRVTLEAGDESRQFPVPLIRPGTELPERILAVGERTPKLEPLRTALTWSAPVPPNPSVIPDRVSAFTTVDAELPEHPHAYDAFRFVLLFETTLPGATERAVDALARWVEGGGTLVCFPGPAWSAEMGETLARLTGLRSVVPNAEAPESARGLIESGPGVYRELVPSDGTFSRHDGLVTVSHVGTGAVYTVAWTPNQEEFPGLVDDTLEPLYETFFEAYYRGGSFAGQARRRLLNAEGWAAHELGSRTGFSFPSSGSVFLAVVLYLVVGFLVPAVYFRRRKRPEWTFAVIAVVSIASTFGIYRFGLLGAIRSARVDEINVLRVNPDSNRAHATSFVSFMSPGYRTVSDVFLPPADAKELVVRSMETVTYDDWGRRTRHHRGREPALPRVDSHGNLTLGDVQLYPNAPRFLRFDYPVTVELPFEVSIDRTTSPLSATVRATETGLSVWVLGRERTGLKALAPGDTYSIENPLEMGTLGYVYNDVYGGGHWAGIGTQHWMTPVVGPRWQVRDLLAQDLDAMRSAYCGPNPNDLGGPNGPAANLSRRVLCESPARLLVRTNHSVFPTGVSFADRSASTYYVIELR